ncbi:hypothetical protein Sa4125_42110 [Aureimonas sp. SA4125]|uniref:DUF1223 domain-containing protein n=1 Tax=Aureimonas sp. SA4125 TaxID=2826993 RepID=UPI001CC7CDEB|nr:DUF1223 domain-containing protein [Aureimonas sp. SA4125]BDA86669.1 hypothetical protein Sa4125_42110 [Aureimonas sp. SA4125]
MIGRVLAFVVAIVMAGPTPPSSAEEHPASSRSVRGVVELFTSQGCSSCPPADRILGRLAKDPEIVALSYHVDYWNYIGWSDPLATRANTDRQRAYSRALGTGTIYTPQVVVNGQRDVVGSREDEIRKALDETALTERKTNVSVDLTVHGDRLHISADGVPPSTTGKPPVLMLITYDEKVETVVDKGENKGLTLYSVHAVRDWRILGMWDGKTLSVDIPVSSMQGANGRKGGCAAVLQSVTAAGAPGPILAAAAIDF